MQEGPDVVQAVESPTVDVPWIRLSTRRQRLRQRHGLITEMSEAPSGMSKAQASQPEQGAARHGPRPDLTHQCSTNSRSSSFNAMPTRAVAASGS
jgi:hypothetical protein